MSNETIKITEAVIQEIYCSGAREEKKFQSNDYIEQSVYYLSPAAKLSLWVQRLAALLFAAT